MKAGDEAAMSSAKVAFARQCCQTTSSIARVADTGKNPDAVAAAVCFNAARSFT
jgi:hypothetical protein